MSILTPNGTDDTAQILAAIAAIPNGGTVELGLGQFRISSEISVSTPNVKIIGQGGCDPFLNGSVPPTSILYVGAAGGKMVSFVDTESCALKGLTLLGNGLAASCLVLYGCQNSNFDLYANGATWAGCVIEASPTRNSDWNDFTRLDIDARAFGLAGSARGSYGLLLDGNGPCNACHNSFRLPNLWYAAVASVYLGDCDNNQWQGLLCGAEPTLQSQYGVFISDPAKARSNYIFHLQAGGAVGVYIANARNPQAVNANRIFGYDQNNGETLPKTDSGLPYSQFLEVYP